MAFNPPLYFPWQQAPAPAGYGTYPPAMWPQWYPHAVHGVGDVGTSISAGPAGGYVGVPPPSPAAGLAPSGYSPQPTFGGFAPPQFAPQQLQYPQPQQIPQQSPYAGPVAQHSPFVGMRRQLIMLFDSTTDVAAGASTTVSTVAQDAVQVYRVVMDPTVAAAFLITDIKIGARSQLSSVGAAMAASTMTPEALSPCSFDSACVGQTLSIAVTNRSGGGARFLLTMFCNALR